jgi:protein ImuB
VVVGVTRMACVRVEAFVAAALERCEPALREQPLAVVTGAPPATRVIEANARARAEGVRSGLSDAEAVVRCPGLVRRPASAEAEAAARHALLDACLSVSPRLEDAAAGIVHVDLGGLGQLFANDAEIGRRLWRQARAVGLEARVGIAASRAAATVATRIGPPVHTLPPEVERAALAAVPVSTLEWPEALAATFARWGLTTLGELAALPRAGIGARLGRPGLAAQDLAAGIDRAPFRVWTPPPFWEEAQGLEWEITTLPALVPVLQRVLDRLCARMAAAHLLVDALEVRLGLASGGHHTRSMALAAPLGDPTAILALLALEIEAHPPGAAVVAVALSARVIPQRAAPGGLWHPPPPAPRDLAAVLTRLALLVGGANVGAPVVVDSHRPDDYTLAPFGDDDRGGGPPTARAGDVEPPDPASAPETPAGPLALRRLRPPRRVEVDTRDGRPIHVRDTLGLDARVETCAGPWRLSGHWWDTNAWARDEWDIELSDGTVWRLANDRLTRQWFLDALYD